MRLFAQGETALAEAWAINGAFSVLGSTLAALAGLMLGSRWLAGLAIPCYATVWMVTYAVTARRAASESEAILMARSMSATGQ
jgi:hypothetical protein